MSAMARPGRRVLVIEGDAAVRDLLHAALEGEGYRVLSADHTVDPVNVSQLRPDLVILDLWLDGRDSGWRVLQDLKVTPGARAIPVLICTADAELVQREAEQLARLAAGVVLKPFDLDDFLARVEACQQAHPPRIPACGSPASPAAGDRSRGEATTGADGSLRKRQSIPVPEVVDPLQLAFPESAVIAPGMEP